jgi:hypothetical protein
VNSEQYFFSSLPDQPPRKAREKIAKSGAPVERMGRICWSPAAPDPWRHASGPRRGREGGPRPYIAAGASGKNIHWVAETPPSTGVMQIFINRLYGMYFTHHTIDWFHSIYAQLAQEFQTPNVCFSRPLDNVHDAMAAKGRPRQGPRSPPLS